MYEPLTKTKLWSLGHSSALSSLKCSCRFLGTKRGKEKQLQSHPDLPLLECQGVITGVIAQGTTRRGDGSQEEVLFGTGLHLPLAFVPEVEQMLCIRKTWFGEVREWNGKMLGFGVIVPSLNPGSPALSAQASHFTSLSPFLLCKWENSSFGGPPCAVKKVVC